MQGAGVVLAWRWSVKCIKLRAPQFPPPRWTDHLEMLDRPAEHSDHLGPGLAEVRLVNRWLGGTAIALDFVQREFEASGRRRLTLLDVAAGTADIPLTAMVWARAHGLQLDVTASDVSEQVLALARRHARNQRCLRLERADATSLSYADGSFDLVMCNLALHHFAPDAAERAMSEMYRVSRRAMLVNDLERSRPAYWAARLLFTATRNPVTRHDGPLSVLRSYTLDELAALASRAGLPTSIEVRRRHWFRMQVVARKAR